MFLKKKNNYNLGLIVSLVIPALISGPFISDLIVSLTSIFFLIFVFKNKLFYFNKRPLIIFFIFCIYCILLSIFVAEDKLLSFQSSLFYFRIGIFACLIWYLIDEDRRVLNYFYYALLISFTALVMDGYIQYFFNFNIIGLPKTGSRISSFFGEELILGSYMSRLFPLMFALFIIKKKKNFEIFFVGLLFAFTDALIYISGERLAFFYLVMSSLIIIIFIKKYKKFRILTLLCGILFVIFVTTLDTNLRYRMLIDPVKSIGLVNNNSEKKYFFTPQHDSLIRTAYNMFEDKFLFGHGPKMFRVICNNKKYMEGVEPCLTHPHNFYVQLLAETGIIGFTFLFSLFIYVLYCLILHFKSLILKKKRYLTDYQICLIASIFITVWPISPNGNFFNNWLAICYSLPFGFYLQSIYGRNKDKISF